MTFTVDELLTTTRSVRRRLDLHADVDLDTVRECLEIALQAPTGSNVQTWRWVVVVDPQQRRRLAALYQDAWAERRAARGPAYEAHDASPRSRMMRSSEYLTHNLADVPIHIVPCIASYVAEDVATSDFARATLYASIYPAVWNLQLALRSRGYGSCLTTLHLMRAREAADLLDIPPTYVQAGLIVVGRLSGSNTFRRATRLPLDDVMSIDRFAPADA